MIRTIPLINLDEVASQFDQVVFPVKWEGQPKILGINPGSVNKDRLDIPPLGILYVAAFARKHGYGQWCIIDNDVIEDNKPIDYFSDQIAWSDIVALTGTTAQCKQAMEIAAVAKSMGKLVIYGGPHATPAWRETLEMSQVDIVVRGEGEVTFLELLDALLEGRDLQTVDGLAFRDANGMSVKTKTRHRNFSLDDIPFPARDLVPTERYGVRPLVRFSTDEPYAHLMMTRGCTDKCKFCNTPNNWGGPAWRSAENLFAEMMEVYKVYGIKDFHFQDDVFTVNQELVRTLCYKLIEERLRKQAPIRFEWSCLARPDQFDYELLVLMKLAGCVQIEIGVESGSEELLKVSQKRYTKDKIRRAFSDARRAGVRTWAFFIVGLPGETMDTWRETVEFAKELKVDGSVWTVLTPYPGTDFYNGSPGNGIEIVDSDWTNWLYKKPVIRVGEFGPDELIDLRDRADREVNGSGYSGPFRLGV